MMTNYSCLDSANDNGDINGGGELCGAQVVAVDTSLPDILDTKSVLKNKKVPNHLVDSHIYSNQCDNELFNCRPKSIHFKGCNVGGSYIQKFRIINISSRCQRLHLIPPASSIFKIFYKKKNSLVPGMYLEVKVVFTPQENINYHEKIYLHSMSSLNLTIPIYAYLELDISSFPKQIQFNSTQVGHCAIKKIPLRNDSPVEFSYQISLVQKVHNDFDIFPLNGLIPANSAVDIFVKFSPTQFCTSCVDIQITTSQFNFEPFHCAITGISEPGMASKLIWNQTDQSPFSNKSKKLHISSNILEQRTVKLQSKVVMDDVNVDSSKSTKQIKKTCFEHALSQNISDEQRNQIRWGVKLGEMTITQIEHKLILKQREKDKREYDMLLGNVVDNNVFIRDKSLLVNCRIYRHAEEHLVSQPSFDIFLNNHWSKRHIILRRFIQVARRVLWILRAKKGLKGLSILLDHWRNGSFKSAKYFNDKSDSEQYLSDKVCFDMLGSNILAFSIPSNSSFDDDAQVDVLNVKETSLLLKQKTCFYNLNIPLQYNLLHFDEHPLSSATKYCTNSLSRKLRKFDNVVEAVVLENLKQSSLVKSKTSISVPKDFFKPPQYHSLHIFNPLIGIQSHFEVLSHTEIDDDYSLSPITLGVPRLEKDGVIPGTMSWKKFPSHALSSMNMHNLYNIYVPRWTDCFDNSSYSPQPLLLTSLPDDDESGLANVSDDLSESTILTMDMICAEFNITEQTDDTSMDKIDSKTAHRDQAQKELSRYISKQLNNLGKKIESHTVHKGTIDLLDISF